MTVNAKPTGRAVSIPAGLATGGIASMAVTIAAAAILAKLISDELVAMEYMGYGIMAILLISSWTGAAVARTKTKRQKWLVSVLAACVYFLTLLAVTALFFGGQYSGAGETGLLILCGSMVGCLLNRPGKTGRKRSRTRTRNR